MSAVPAVSMVSFLPFLILPIPSFLWVENTVFSCYLSYLGFFTQMPSCWVLVFPGNFEKYSLAKCLSVPDTMKKSGFKNCLVALIAANSGFVPSPLLLVSCAPLEK